MTALPTVLLVGASRGLGRALAEEHLRRGWHVIATVRDPAVAPDLSAGRAAMEVHRLDTTDWDRVAALRHALDGRVLDRLVVSAAIAGTKRPVGETDPAEAASMMITNAYAPLWLIDLFVDLVPAHSTVAVMSSSLGSVSGNNRPGWELYRMSKAALNQGLRSLSHRRAAEGRTYIAADPGWVRTDMGGPAATLSVEESVPRLADMLDDRGGRGGCAFVNYTGADVSWWASAATKSSKARTRTGT